MNLPPWPTARATRATIEPQFGEAQADLIHWALTTGDPLADAAAAEMHELGTSAVRKLFNEAVRSGIDSIDDPPPALRALLEHAESVATTVDDEILERGTMPYFTTRAAVHLISLSAGSLVRVYESPSIAKVLTTTGRLSGENARRRIEETGSWLTQVMVPGSLHRGEPGYIATMQVRLLHANMRRLAYERGYDDSADGVPINQVDLGRTWMDFTLTAYSAEEKLGFELTPAELASLYTYWGKLGALLGIDERLVEGIDSNDAARRLDDAFQAVTGPLDKDSAALAAATLSAVADLLKDLVKVPYVIGRPVLRAITRRIQGPEMSNDLGIRRALVAEPALRVLVNRITRKRTQRREHQDEWDSEVQRNLDVARDLVAQQNTPPTAYQRGATRATD